MYDVAGKYDSFIFKFQGSKDMYSRTDIFSCAILM
jgi:hypothetical protein